MKKKLIGLTALVSILLLASCGKGGDKVRVDLLPVKLTDDGKWSMVDKDGEIRYSEEFKEAPSAVVEGYFTAEEKNGYNLYKAGDKKPEEMPECSGLKYAGYMHGGLMPVTRKDSRISVIGTDGKDRFELAPVGGHEIVACNTGFAEGMLLFQTDEEKYGFYGDNGKVAIEPQYDAAFAFSEGKAVVGKKKEVDGKTEVRLSVIDKSGKVLFQLKDKYELACAGFSNGWLVAENDDKVVLIDEKGEITPLRGKVKAATPVSKDMIIFKDGDDQYGLMKIDGEILIRAKYMSLIKGDGDQYFGQRDKNEVAVLNSKGDVQETLDFREVGYIDGFGYIGYDGKTYQILDSKFKPVGDDFEAIGNLTLCDAIRTDYFNFGSVVNTVSEQFDEALKQFPIGASASKVMAGQKPSDFSYRSSYKPEDLAKKLFNYQTQVEISFTASLADYNWNPATYSGDYSWNDASTVDGVNVQYDCEHWLSLANHKEMVAEFKKKSYNVVKEGMYQGAYAAVLKKGDVGLVIVTKGTRGGIIAGKATNIDAFMTQVEGKYVEQKEGDGDSSSSSIEMPEPEVVEEAVDTMAFEPDSDYDF